MDSRVKPGKPEVHQGVHHRVYFPMWFKAKVKPSFIEGPRHVLKQLELLTCQKKKVQNLVAPQVAIRAWFSHGEALLQTRLCSEAERGGILLWTLSYKLRMELSKANKLI